MEKFEAMDSDFVQAVMQCGRNGVSESLAEILESDYPLNALERKMLAELARGEYRLPKNHKSGQLTGEQERDIANYYLEQKETVLEKVAVGNAEEYGKKKYGVKKIAHSFIRKTASSIAKIPK